MFCSGIRCGATLQAALRVRRDVAVRNGYNSTRRWAARRANRQALARFAEFWQTPTKNAEAGGLRERNQRHWTIASIDEVRTALRGCKVSLRVVSAQAKRFEPQLIEEDRRR